MIKNNVFCEQDIIAQIKKTAQDSLVGCEENIGYFIDYFYAYASVEDLQERNVVDLYGMIVSIWQKIATRVCDEDHVCVYNPRVEEHGWQSKYSIIEIVTKDRPFLLESLRLLLNKLDIGVNWLIYANNLNVARDEKGKLLSFAQVNAEDKLDKQNNLNNVEAVVYIEIDRITDEQTKKTLQDNIIYVLGDIKKMVNDWQQMQQMVFMCINQLQLISRTNELQQKKIQEAMAFLQWLSEGNFTFIGFASYCYDKGDFPDAECLQYIENSALGVLRNSDKHNKIRFLQQMPCQLDQLYKNKEVLFIGKTNTLATVHRPAYTDFISIKLVDNNGQLQTEHRFIGLYTSSAYRAKATDIPFVRHKIQAVLAMSTLPENNYYRKMLLNIIENLPHEELFHASCEDLYNLSFGILHLQERPTIRLFCRHDICGRYYSALVFVPKEKFNSGLRKKIQAILFKEFAGVSIDFTTKFSESTLARIHFIVRVAPHNQIELDIYDVKKIEKKIQQAAKTWCDELNVALYDHYGDEQAGNLLKSFCNAFPASYSENFTPRRAVLDIDNIQSLLQAKTELAMSLYRPIEEDSEIIKFKLFRMQENIPLSYVVPMLENMGLRIISARPYRLVLQEDQFVWINDYRMEQPEQHGFSLDAVKDIFQQAFLAMWNGEAENDGFNSLVLQAQLSWRDISIIRAYCKYLWQVGFGFSQSSVEETFAKHPGIAKKLIQLFYTLFDPDKHTDNYDMYVKAIEQDLIAVKSLNEDKIIRSLLSTILATLRTNFFQRSENNKYKNYLSIKLDSSKVPELPLPRPLYEIFVYSPYMEGIHLRADKVARGGIRWSDRHDDFRTEILGLMKAQQVKNSVIVPMGAKGGFVVKNKTLEKAPDVVECYKNFIRGLLDLTDNRVDGNICSPAKTVCRDLADPYLVVAADKGTATFSDIANSISQEYNFWLQDAFASGGSAGYDHKKMGITARGAWESVKVHFQRFNIDVQTSSIKVIGIGDMSGDVFGNGMLLSRMIKLVAAFNHQHIFLDPNPEPYVSYQERERLFSLPRSQWSDYDKTKLSAGGGIYSRQDKSITISTEAQQLLECDKNVFAPNELIKAILMSPVDLLWNGGVGTFVKAKSQSHIEAGDRASDAIRIDADKLRAKVVAEGGNLGFTQLGRVEFASLGGVINTDAIDNSAGVNCSDAEVNIKVLLNDLIAKGDMTLKQRNQLLSSMSEEVAELVLINNIKQNKAISIEVKDAAKNIQMHHHLLRNLETYAGLDRVVEYLPDVEEISRRKSNNQGFTRPEIAILLSYTKIYIKKQLLASDFPEDEYVDKVLIDYFPKPLQANFVEFIAQHRLRREIIATQISNHVVDEMGIGFVHRLHDETGANIPEIIRAYIISRELFGFKKIYDQINHVTDDIELQVKFDVLQEINRLLRRGARWFLRNRRSDLQINKHIDNFKPLIVELQNNIDRLLSSDALQLFQQQQDKWQGFNLPDNIINLVAQGVFMYSALDIVDAAILAKIPVLTFAKVYFLVGGKLQLGWFRELIRMQPINHNWEALARAVFRDDIDKQQRNLSLGIINYKENLDQDLDKHVQVWLDKNHSLLDRWYYLLNELKNNIPDFTMFAVALRELLDLYYAISHTTK